MHIGLKFTYLIDKDTGLSKRTIDLNIAFQQVLDAVATLAEQSPVQLIVAGDFYDKINPIPETRKHALEMLKELPGNVITYIIGGNHDTPRDISRGCSVDELSLLRNVNTYRNVTGVKIDDNVGLVFVPFIRPAFIKELLEKAYQKSLPNENQQEIILMELAKKIKDEFNVIASCKVKIAITHYYYQGFKYHAMDVGPRDSEFYLQPEMFDNFDLVLNGHVHCPQNSGKVWVVGSTEATRFDERDEQKRFLVINAEGKVSSHLITIRPQKFIKITYKGNIVAFNTELAGYARAIKDALVKIEVTCKSVDSQYVLNNMDFDIFKNAFYVHAPEFIREEEDLQKSVSRERLKASFTSNFLSYVETDEEASGLDKNMVKEIGTSIIQSVGAKEAKKNAD